MTETELIARLETATEGSDVLDRAIAAHCGITWSSDEDGNYGPHNMLPRRCWFSRDEGAALSLVPERWSKTTWMKRHNGHHWSVELHIPSSECEGRHVHLPLAIVIASLRARSRM